MSLNSQIADLILEKGRAQAQGTAGSGQAWGSAISQIGQHVAQDVANIPNMREHAAQLQDAERQRKARERLAFHMQNTPSVNQNGAQLIDSQSIAQKMTDDGFGPDALAALPHINDLNTSIMAYTQAKQAPVRAGAKVLVQTGNQPEMVHRFIDEEVVPSGMMTPDQAKSAHQQIDADPSNAARFVAMWAGPQEFENAPQGSMARNKGTGALVPGSAVPDRPVAQTAAGLAAAAHPGDPQGALDALNPPPVEKTPAPPAVGSLADYLTRYAKEHNKTVDQLTTAEIEAQTKKHTDATQKAPALGGMNSLYAEIDPKSIASQIRSGAMPPDISQYGRPASAAIASELSKPGPNGEAPYNMSTAQLDWKATQKHIATLNSTQQTRLMQSINTLPELLDSVSALAGQWKGGRFPILNKANLALAKGGAYGSDVASVANKLDAQIADVTSDLGNVYMGGYTPTDQSLLLAKQALNSSWDAKVLQDMIKLARNNVQIRKNSINNTGVQGASAGNPYAPEPAAPAPSAAPKRIRYDINGNKIQ